MSATNDIHDLSRLKIERRPAAKRSGGFGAWLGLVMLIALGGAGYWSWQRFGQPSAAPIDTAVVVRVNPVAAAEITSANGYVIPRVKASVASQTQGRLVRLLVDTGARVDKDQVLAEIQHDELDAAVAEAEATAKQREAEVTVWEMAELQAAKAVAAASALLEEAKTAVAETQATLAQAESEYIRQEDLFGRGDTSVQVRDRARTERDVLQARLAVGWARVKTAEAEAERATAARAWNQRSVQSARTAVEPAVAAATRARAVRDLAIVRAPFAGVILRKDAEVGEVVSPAAFGGSGSKTAIVTMADFASLEFEVDVFERDIRLIQEEQPCRIVLDAFPSEPMVGAVRRIEPTANKQDATIKVKIALPKPHPRMLPEMGGRAVFLRAGGEQQATVAESVFVAKAALTKREGREGVFLVEAGAVRFVRVETGGPKAGDVQILAGVRGGERVVLDPAPDLADGQKVTAR